jgi:hypothetical protein
MDSPMDTQGYGLWPNMMKCLTKVYTVGICDIIETCAHISTTTNITFVEVPYIWVAK